METEWLAETLKSGHDVRKGSGIGGNGRNWDRGVQGGGCLGKGEAYLGRVKLFGCIFWTIR